MSMLKFLSQSQSLFIYIAHLKQPSVDQSAVQAITTILNNTMGVQ